MRLGGRLAAAIEVLEDMEQRRRPVADALKDWGLSHRFAGSGDRAAIGNIVYDALRRRRSAAWLMDDDTPLALASGALMLEDWGAAEAVAAELAADRFAPAGLDPRMAEYGKTRDLVEAPQGARADCPEWCEPHLAAAYGGSWVGEGAALAARPPLDMRINTLRAGRAKVLGALARAGAQATPIAADGIRVPPTRGPGRHPNVQAEPAFHKGWFEVQDEGSQVVARLAGAEPGAQVLDFCAGAGGKTLALSAAMGNRGQIFAHDAERQRLAPIFDRLKRAGSRNVQVIADIAALAGREGQMDLVVADAPCTGSGTWRRRPDAKWRLTPKQLGLRQAEQDAILDAASRFVKPGGRLVYITCSLFREENHDRVAAFLARAESFAALDAGAQWAACFPAFPEAARVEAGLGLSLSPALTGTDGFFLSLLERRG